MTVRQRLIDARKQCGLSQVELGDEVNAAQSTVATWERGKNEPDLATIKRLAKVLDVSAEWLAFGTAAVIPKEMKELLELNVRAVSGPGGLIDATEDDEDAVRARYFFPPAEVRAVLMPNASGCWKSSAIRCSAR